MKIVANNKKAFHDYEILEKHEAGIVLFGSEVKSVREGRVNLKDSYIRIEKNELFLLQAHISYMETTNSFYRKKYDEIRKRKLLMHKIEIAKLFSKVAKQQLTLVPIKIYFSSKNLIKVEIALAKGKKTYDKRNDLKEKQQKREISRAIKNSY
jgi:SsrA-binding protein